MNTSYILGVYMSLNLALRCISFFICSVIEQYINIKNNLALYFSNKKKETQTY